MEFVNEVLPDVSDATSAASASAAGSVDGGEDVEDDLEEGALAPSYAHYNMADMLRRRWAIHIRTMLSAAGVSPTPEPGSSGGTVSSPRACCSMLLLWLHVHRSLRLYETQDVPKQESKKGQSSTGADEVSGLCAWPRSVLRSVL